MGLTVSVLAGFTNNKRGLSNEVSFDAEFMGSTFMTPRRIADALMHPTTCVDAGVGAAALFLSLAHMAEAYDADDEKSDMSHCAQVMLPDAAFSFSVLQLTFNKISLSSPRRWH